MSFPRYPAYKDSGVQWLGQIPAHWDVSQSRRMFKVRSETALPTDRMLTASQKYGVLYQTDFVEREGRWVVEVILGKENLKHVEPDDFIISMRSFQGGIEWCKLAGSTSFHYVMLTPVKHVHPPFFAHLLKSSRYIEALRTTTDLIRDGQELRFSNFAQVDLPILPQNEQQAIAAFLDRETAKIDDLVAEQEQLITLLKEKRQAVISHAVTKGLDPSVPMKDSGVEWLGEVPAHWSVTPLRWVASCRSGEGLAATEVEASPDEAHTVPVVGGNGLMGYTDAATVDHQVLAVGRVGALCGNVHVVSPPAWITDNALIVDPDLCVFDILFLSAVLRIRNLNDIASKTAQPLITGTQVSDQRLPAPPSDEQRALVEHLSNLTTSYSGLINEAVLSIELLRERRSALISAAVTGQIDVRGLAPAQEQAA